MDMTDYEKIISLWHEAEGVILRDADSYEGIKKYLHRNPRLSFVAEEKGKIVGTIMSGHDGKRGYIQHLTVISNQRKSGIGSELLSLCIHALKKEGIVKSHIHVLINNEPAKNFWSNRGWIKRTDIEVYSYINNGSENT
jgi:ribosomal protein S18 acetylase RimI-like enzyme